MTVRTLLIIATAVEIALVIGVLAVYLVLITRTLRRTNRYLGQVSFGVRAIESQCAPIGPSVTRINEQLATITGALDDLGDLAEAAATPSSSTGGPHGR
jgi:uncharacterized protein YoxC